MLRSSFVPLLAEDGAEIVEDLLRAYVVLSHIRQELEDQQHQVSTSSNEHVQTQVNEELQDHLLQIEEALVRLEQGEFGICLKCWSPISAHRLRLIPWVRYCVPCQQQETLEQELQGGIVQ